MAVPASTYRLQITSGFTLDDAAAVTDYLRELGVGAVYCSPLLVAAAGSDHGYDVVEHERIDPTRGGGDEWADLVAAARAQGLGLVVDIVPNHAGVADASENPSWWDVLKLGRDSAYADWYDIEWSRGRILLPVLGDDADLATELKVVGDELRYYDHRFPIAPGTPAGTPAQVHDRQAYELVNFRRADTEQNYRRFFAVTTLAGLRVEDPAIFDATHIEILRWVNRDGIDGIRIDHPDGLADPEGYLERLAASAPGRWITVEKILEPGELLSRDWPVAGTTGYDALTEVSQVLTDPATVPALDTLYRELTGDALDFHGHVEAGKRSVVTSILHAEVLRLARLAPGVPDAAAALAELLVAFPVYRSYHPAGAEHLAAAITAVHGVRPDLDDAVASLTARLCDPADELCVRFQQTSGAIMAKGVEDTAYYRYTRFIAANEVGGDPARPGGSVAQFHAAQQQRQDLAADGMTTLSTHDTKRGEDVRARLMVLAELPEQWGALVRRCLAAAPIEDLPFAYLLWQTIVGVGFVDRDRVHAYVEKAMREANVSTHWIDPVEAFEATVHAAVDFAYDDPSLRADIQAFLDVVTPHGWSNALSQKLIGLTMPGVPDVYQGTDLWEDSLVDPDNRRPVDYDERRRLLAGLDTPPLDATGAAKLWLVSRTLRLRREHPDRFVSYTPLTVGGPAADHAIAYDRGGVAVVATRLPVGLAEQGWAGTALDLPRPATDLLTGSSFEGTVALADLLATYPVALLSD